MHVLSVSFNIRLVPVMIADCNNYERTTFKVGQYRIKYLLKCGWRWNLREIGNRENVE